jgi:uncharacterized protein DUF4352
MSHHACTRRTNTAAVLGAAAGLTTAVLLMASCSASPPHPAHKHGGPPTPHAGTAATPAPGTSAPPTGTSTGQLGATLAVSDTSGTRLGVTLKKLIDPASGANQYSNPAKGSHFVSVKLRIHNTAASTYQNNANNETTITLANGKKLYADYNPIAGCGNFDNGQITVKSGAASTGCVTFQVPKGQKVIKVGYRNTVFPGQSAEWHVS